MKKRVVLPVSVLLGILASGLVAAQTLPELFGRAKEEVKAGSWADASEDSRCAPGGSAQARQRERAEAARGPARLLPRRLQREPRPEGPGGRELHDVSQAAARRDDRRGCLLEEGGRRIREGAEGSGGARAVARRGLQGVPAGEKREGDRPRGPVLGRRSGPLDPDGLGEGRLVGAVRSQRARRVRRGLLDRASGASRRRRAHVPSGVRAARRFRRRQSRRSRPRSAAA